MSRTLIVNADDFGRTSGVNRGIIRAHEEGIVTSATLMVRWPAAAEAGQYAQWRRELSVGLHLDLSEWIHVDGEWRQTDGVIDPEDARQVTWEVDRQLEVFADLVGRSPSHLDSHHHVHREEPVRRALASAGERLEVPVREVTPGITYCGDFYGQDSRGDPYPEAITVDALAALIRRLPAGVTELGCHPGDPSDLVSTYADERAPEVEVLCHPDIRRTLDEEGVVLAGFGAMRLPLA